MIKLTTATETTEFFNTLRYALAHINAEEALLDAGDEPEREGSMTVSELKCMYCGEPIKYDDSEPYTERLWIHSSTDRYSCNYTNPDLFTHATPAQGDVAVQANDVERLTRRIQELEKALSAMVSDVNRSDYHSRRTAFEQARAALAGTKEQP